MFFQRLANKNKLSIIIFLLPIILLWSAEAFSADTKNAEEFGIEEKPDRNETVLDLIFGSSPALPTERGILVIDAFHDLDNNGNKDENEPELRDEIVCKIDRINYTLPAFIPALDYNTRYEIRCSGIDFYPTMADREILIEHRGHIIEISLPCRKFNPDPTSKPG